VALFAIFGPFFAPYGENEVVGPPYSSQGLLGTDYLGQSVLARLMYGGINVLVIAVLATLLSTVLGTLIGVVAAYGGGWWDEVIMRLNDVLLAFPQILLALVVLTSVNQQENWMVVVLVGLSNAPRTARIARGVALGVVSRDFVHAAEALGERPVAGHPGRGAAEHDAAAARGGRAAADVLDRPGGRPRVPRPHD
jgi:peptide/nickel transport system permease protein